MFLGAGVGGALRYLVSTLVSEMVPRPFPWGTTLVNFSGCLVMGVLTAILLNSEHPPLWKLIAIVGFLGGFTTFSAYSIETIQLFEARKYAIAIANITVSNLFSIGACAVGYFLFRKHS